MASVFPGPARARRARGGRGASRPPTLPGRAGRPLETGPRSKNQRCYFLNMGVTIHAFASLCRRGATPWGVPSGDPEAKAATGSVEFCVNEQFYTDRVDPRAHHSPIKSRHSRWLCPETRREVNGDGSCTNQSAIAIKRQNLCGRLNKSAITFAARFVCLWPCLGSLSPDRMKRPARDATRMRAAAPAAAGSPHARAANERRPPIKARAALTCNFSIETTGSTAGENAARGLGLPCASRKHPIIQLLKRAGISRPRFVDDESGQLVDRIGGKLQNRSFIPRYVLTTGTFGISNR
jgi:hypothetical protein